MQKKYAVIIAIILFVSSLTLIIDNIVAAKQPNNIQEQIVEKIDLGYNLETKEQMWKYPNETEWRHIDG